MEKEPKLQSLDAIQQMFISIFSAKTGKNIVAALARQVRGNND
jgi:hypothetical protein